MPGPGLTWSSWFLSISNCGKFSSVMLTDCAMLGRRTNEEEAGSACDALANLRGISVVPPEDTLCAARLYDPAPLKEDGDFKVDL